MEILLPIAHTEINVIEVLILGIVVGVLSGMLGIGGGIILNPILIKMGIPSVVVVGTSISQMIGASLSGFLNYLKAGKVDTKMGKYVVIYGVIGGFVGVLLINYLKQSGDVKRFILLVYTVYLFLLCSFIFYESFKNKEKHEHKAPEFIKNLPLKKDFNVGQVSLIVPAGIGLLSGFLAAVMGIGGGNLVVPALMYLAGYDVVSAIAISVFQMVFITSFLSFLHSYFNHGVDIILGLILLIGSSFGAVFGSILGQKINRFYLKVFLAFLMLIVAAYSLKQFLSTKQKEIFNLVSDNFFANLLANHPLVYSILVIVISLVVGYIISIITIRVKDHFVKKFLNKS
jgi:uncharacterized membrane protein YfcA